MQDDELTTLPRMNFHRKWALAIVAVSAGVYAMARLPDPGFSPVGVFTAVVSAIAILSLFVGAGVALFTRPTQTSDRMRTVERFLPAVVLVLCLGVMSMLVRQHNRDAVLEFAAKHGSELAGPAPQGVIYTEGIPDGGTAIVASPGRDPMTYTARVRFELTNGNMTSCKPVDSKLWLCRFG